MANVHSDIRGPLFVEALKMQANGTPVLKLNTGNPGCFGFGMPESVRKALLEHVDEAVPYCDLKGMPAARESIAAYHRGNGLLSVTADDVFIGNGVSEVASMLLTAMLSTGDEILMPTPCYSLWSNSAYLCDATPVLYRCDPKQDWYPDLDDIVSKITPKTKAILLINPNNPTGAVYGEDFLQKIIRVARDHHLVIISDEIYDRLVLDDLPYTSIAALAPDVPCITLNGLSKSHIVCGFRCGWMVFTGPGLEEIRDAVTQLASMRLCGNALTQLVIPAAMADRASTQAMIVPGGRLYEQRRATVEGLKKIEGVSFCENKASFYLFPGLDRDMYDFADGNDFAMKFLHEKHILVIPGTGFLWSEDLRFRIVMLPEAPVLTDGMQKLGEFLHDHRR